mgnify:FL=1
MSGLASLSRRERVMVLGGGALMIALSLWRFGWQPVQAERAQLAQDMERYLTLMSVADQAQQPRAADSAPRDTRPLPLRVTQSADAAGLNLTRLAPENGALQVTLAEADFAAVIDWIAALESQAAVRVTVLSLDRLPAPGRVSARMTLEEAT